MEILHKLSSCTSKLQDLITPCWLIYFTIKSIMIQCLQCYYLLSSEYRYGHNGNLTRCSSLSCHLSDQVAVISNHQSHGDFKLSRAYSLLADLGSVYRELGTTAVFCYAHYTFVAIFYPKIPLFCDKLKQVYKEEFFVFLTNPNDLRQIVSREIRTCVDSALESNLNYLKSTMASLSTANHGPKLHQVLSEIRQREKKLGKEKDEVTLCDYIELVSPMKSQANRCNLRISSWLRKSIDDLRRQYNYLLELRQDDSRVWPSNRHTDRRRKISMDFLKLETAVVLIVYLFAQTSTILAQYLGFKAIKNNRSLPDRLRKFSISERVMLLDQFVYATLTCYWFSSPLVMLIVIFRDQMLSLELIEQRFRRYNFLVAKLGELKQQKLVNMQAMRMRHFQSIKLESLSKSIRGKRSIRSNLRLRKVALNGNFAHDKGEIHNSLLDERMLYCMRPTFGCQERDLGLKEDELRIACDKEALEIYISFKIFMRQADGPMMLAKNVMFKNLLFIVNCLAMTLIFFKGIDSSHFQLLVILLIIVMSLVNVALFVCAKFGSTCAKVFRSIFSLISQALDHQASSEAFRRAIERDNNDTNRGHEKFQFAGHAMIGRWNQQSDQHHRNRLEASKLAPSSIHIEHLSGLPLNPHTLLLWRRLARDHEPITRRFVCTVAGVFKLDFRNILRFNYWIISLVLFAITNRLRLL